MIKKYLEQDFEEPIKINLLNSGFRGNISETYDKNEAMVKYTLLEDNKKIFASNYKLYLPTEKKLERELTREREMIEMERDWEKKMSNNNYQDYTKEDLIKEVERLKKRKKFGLMWKY